MKKAKELFLRLWNLAWNLYRKYEEIVVYLIVGVLTTIVSWGAAWFATLFLNPNAARS